MQAKNASRKKGPGRPPKKAARPNEFALWLQDLIEHRHITRAVVAEVCGVDDSTVSRWLSGEMRSRLEKAVRFAILSRVASKSEATDPPQDKPIWMRAERRETRMFTAMVSALRRLERLSPKSPQAWKTRVAWEAMLGGSRIVLDLASWSDKDWRELFESGRDLWLRPEPGYRPEEETLRERLQSEIGFPNGQ
jgi:transcriptional regulator with XRE-family HTH domain